MFGKGISSFLFRPRTTPAPVQPQKWFEKQLMESGLNAKISREHLKKSQATVKVYYNTNYLPDELAVQNSLTKIPAVNVAGDRSGYFQNGLSFPSDLDFFANIPEGHPELLSPVERLISAKKLIFSESHVFASGGYPNANPVRVYPKPINVGLFSLPGATFENSYLHYRLFMLDPKNFKINTAKFESIYKNLPTEFAAAKNELGTYDLNHSLIRIRTGLPYLARTSSGTYYPSFTQSNAVIFQSEAYFRHLLEDTSLLLTSVNDAAKSTGRPAFLKATAVGMGFFAKIDGHYDIQHMLYPYFLRAFRKLLNEQSYPWIAKVEFPLFSERQHMQFESVFEDYKSSIEVIRTGRDVLQFTEKETDIYFPCAVNPSDAFAYTGNEWGFGSVESMIGNNSSLRFDQVIHANPLLLDIKHHIPVRIMEDYQAKIEATSIAKPRSQNLKIETNIPQADADPRSHQLRL
ncbi:type IV secretion protein Dot [Legionella sp. km535]|uniref:type IV secretion protein Dot n=1 Tax=Legionella sp. km535 TaxID=2498107 RepID=UPI000F8D25BC|nr:type IV secretion protein Dot [Legionella sp. km535]RUR20695.1 type IV secretion protein Dot [Legionella sp. km535]